MIASAALAVAECTIASHEAMKLDRLAWMRGTERMPHRADEDTYTESPDGGLDHWRNCRSCRSTLMREVPSGEAR